MRNICIFLLLFIYNIHSFAIFTKKIKIMNYYPKIEDFPKKSFKTLHKPSKLYETSNIVNKTTDILIFPNKSMPKTNIFIPPEEDIEDTLDAGEIPWEIFTDLDNKNNYTKYIK